jgi:hypothetical protein
MQKNEDEEMNGKWNKYKKVKHQKTKRWKTRRLEINQCHIVNPK